MGFGKLTKTLNKPERMLKTAHQRMLKSDSYKLADIKTITLPQGGQLKRHIGDNYHLMNDPISGKIQDGSKAEHWMTSYGQSINAT